MGDEAKVETGAAPAAADAGGESGEPASGRGWYHLLLGYLFLMLLLQPLISGSIGAFRAGGLLLGVVLFGAVCAVGRTRLRLIIAILLGVPPLGLLLIVNDPTHHARGIGLFFGIAFFLYVVVMLLMRILSHRVVTRETVSGALCVYILLGLMWSFAYDVADHLEPGSFQGITASTETNDDAEAEERRLTDLRYFSFVTMTTLGYGDITPTSPMTRSLAALEAILGQIYLAVLVARLVAVQVARANREAGSPSILTRLARRRPRP